MRRPRVTPADIAVAQSARRAMLAVLALPEADLERALELAHECTKDQQQDPPEIFAAQGVSRQMLRMIWHFRSNLQAVMPHERRT